MCVSDDENNRRLLDKTYVATCTDLLSDGTKKEVDYLKRRDLKKKKKKEQF